MTTVGRSGRAYTTITGTWIVCDAPVFGADAGAVGSAAAGAANVPMANVTKRRLSFTDNPFVAKARRPAPPRCGGASSGVHIDRVRERVKAITGGRRHW
jgi:hypothetical protein